MKSRLKQPELSKKFNNNNPAKLLKNTKTLTKT